MRLPCCFIPCEADADFAIYGESGAPDDYTHSCEAHLGPMVGTPDWLDKPNRRWEIVSLLAPTAKEAPRG